MLVLRLLQLLSIYTALVGTEVVKYFLRALVEDFLRPFHASDAKIDIPSVLEELGGRRCQASRTYGHGRASLCGACPAYCIGQASASGVERLLVALSERRAQGGHRAPEHVLRGEEGQGRLVLAQDAVVRARLPRVRRLLPLLHEIATIKRCASRTNTTSSGMD